MTDEKADLWVMEVPVLSTAHMPTEHALETLEGNTPIAAYPEGWFLYVGEESSGYEDTPEWLEELFLWAESRGYTWVRFDRDGDAIDELPQFDW